MEGKSSLTMSHRIYLTFWFSLYFRSGDLYNPAELEDEDEEGMDDASNE